MPPFALKVLHSIEDGAQVIRDIFCLFVEEVSDDDYKYITASLSDSINIVFEQKRAVRGVRERTEAEILAKEKKRIRAEKERKEYAEGIRVFLEKGNATKMAGILRYLVANSNQKNTVFGIDRFYELLEA